MLDYLAEWDKAQLVLTVERGRRGSYPDGRHRTGAGQGRTAGKGRGVLPRDGDREAQGVPRRQRAVRQQAPALESFAMVVTTEAGSYDVKGRVFQTWRVWLGVRDRKDAAPRRR